MIHQAALFKLRNLEIRCPSLQTKGSKYMVTTVEKYKFIWLGVSKDDCGSHRAFIEKYNLNFPLLADTDGNLYKLFGIKGRSTVVIEGGKVTQFYPLVNPQGHSDLLLSKL
jgi:peroxiredoxin Q/BCP